MSLDHVFPKKTLLVWNKEAGFFKVLRMCGNHWHTIGFPLEGVINVFPEEAFFLVEASQAAYALKDEESFSDSVNDLIDYFMQQNVCKYEDLRTYLTLKKLGYILWRHDNPYLANITEEMNSAMKYVVFKPNSGFQKKAPSGFLGCLYLTDADEHFLTTLEHPGVYSVGDEANHLYIRVEDVTDKLLSIKS